MIHGTGFAMDSLTLANIQRSARRPTTLVHLDFGSNGSSTFDDGNVAVVIAVTIVLMMQMAIDKVIHMVAMRYRGMPATRTVNMVCCVPAACVPPCA